jgi:hypothetical protein
MELTVDFLVLKSSPLAHVLTQINQVHIVTPCFCTIYFIVSLLSTPKSPKWSRSFSFILDTLFKNIK